eukprot:3668382-Amphidinium_carterae.1
MPLEASPHGTGLKDTTLEASPHGTGLLPAELKDSIPPLQPFEAALQHPSQAAQLDGTAGACGTSSLTFGSGRPVSLAREVA